MTISFQRLPDFISVLVLLAAGWLLVVLAYRDLSDRRLPTAWVGAYAALFPLYAWANGLGWTQLSLHLVIGLVALLLSASLFALGIMGGGDVKLWAGLMLWAGPQGAVTALVIATLLGSLVGVLGWIAQRILRRNRKPVGAGLFRMLSVSRGVPYGVGLAIAGIQNLWVAGL